MGPRDNLPGCKINPTLVITRNAESFDSNDRPADLSHHSHDCGATGLRTTQLATRLRTDELRAEEPHVRIMSNAVADRPQRFKGNTGVIPDRVDQQNPSGAFVHIFNGVDNLGLTKTQPSPITPHTGTNLFRQGRIAHPATLGRISTGRKQP